MSMIVENQRSGSSNVCAANIEIYTHYMIFVLKQWLLKADNLYYGNNMFQSSESSSITSQGS